MRPEALSVFKKIHRQNHVPLPPPVATVNKTNATEALEKIATAVIETVRAGDETTRMVVLMALGLLALLFMLAWKKPWLLTLLAWWTYAFVKRERPPNAFAVNV